jgi:opacity protein-like surface antigen
MSSKLLALALGVAMLAPAAAFACSADQMAGAWQCSGGSGACVAGHDVSRVFQASDGTWRLKDGMGYEAQLDVDGTNVTAHYLDGPRAGGSALTATVDATCQRIAWSEIHADHKL